MPNKPPSVEFTGKARMKKKDGTLGQMGALLPSHIYALRPEPSGMPMLNGLSELTASPLTQPPEWMRSEVGSRTKGELPTSSQ